MYSGRDHRTAAHQPSAGLRPPGAYDRQHAEALLAAVRAAPEFVRPARWRLRVQAEGAELHAGPSRCPTFDPIGRGRAIAGGAALRNLELAVANLGYRPAVRLLPDADDPLHLATVLTGDGRHPDPVDRRLHRAIPIPHRHSHLRPFAGRPVAPPLRQRLHDAASQPDVLALPMGGDRLRTVGTVLAAAASHRLDGEDELADVELWLSGHGATRTPRTDRAMLIDQLGRGALLLITTASDRSVDWIRAGWAMQHAWLTAVSSGLAASVVGGVLTAPGVRSALAARLRLDGCPQLLLRAGWAYPPGPCHVSPG